MTAKRHERTRARRAALQVLYTSEITDASPTAIAETGDGRLAEDGPLPAYALALVRGIEAHRCAIDDQLVATSENWSLARMPIVDRSILRLAAYEMMYVDDVPVSVAINEAVELAKDFGGEDESPRFVNGVLGRIAKRLEDAAPASAAASSDTVEAPDAAPASDAAPACDSAASSDAAPASAVAPASDTAASSDTAPASDSQEGGEAHGV